MISHINLYKSNKKESETVSRRRFSTLVGGVTCEN